MSDKVQPKAKKSAKDAAAKKAAAPKHPAAGAGHNSGQIIPELVKIVDEILASGERMKKEAKLQRDLRNRAKTEFGILSGPLAHEIRLRKMDEDVRVQFESGHGDLKKALGYQPALDFVGTEPTAASKKAQPSEAELKGKPQSFHVEEDAEDEGEEGDEGGEAEGEEDPDKMPPIPANLRRGVIEREG